MTENGSATSRGLGRRHPEERACASASAESNARAHVSKGARRALAKRSQAAAARERSTRGCGKRPPVRLAPACYLQGPVQLKRV